MRCGELLQVERLLKMVDGLIHSTKVFTVYKIDFDMGRWVETKSLGSAALFLGNNTSTYLSYLPILTSIS